MPDPAIQAVVEAAPIRVEVTGAQGPAGVSAINNAAEKTTPVDADRFALTDSAASYVLKKVTWANIKATLAGVFASRANNLSDLTNASTARTNLGLGTAAVLNTGATNGTVPLIGAGDKLPASVIPAVDLVDSVAVANQAARLALSLSAAQSKVVVQTDDGTSWMLIEGGTPATAGDWLQVGDRAITSADITDATSDGATNPGKVLKTDAFGILTVSSITLTGGVTFTNGGYTGDLGSTLTGNRAWTMPDASGNVALTGQTDGTIRGTDLDYANTADIGADLADADEVLVSDGGGNTTRRKSALSRFWTYIKAKIDAGQTWAGVHAFSSTTRPTSAGTGTPNSDSLITLNDAREQILKSPTALWWREDFESQQIGGIVSGTWYNEAEGTSSGRSFPTSTWPNIGIARLSSGTDNLKGTAMYKSTIGAILSNAGWEACFVFKTEQTTNSDVFVGFTSNTGTAGLYGSYGGPSFGVRYSSARDTNFMFMSKNTNSDYAANDSNNYELSTGVAADTSFHTLRIRSTSAGNIEMKFDSGSWTSIAHVNNTGSSYFPVFLVLARTTAQQYIQADFSSFLATGLSR